MSANPEPPAPPSTPETEPPAPGLDVAAIEARCAAATPGPWTWESGAERGGKYSQYMNGAIQPDICDFGDGEQYYPTEGTEPSEANIAFMCHARTDVPALLAALRAAEQERESAVLAERERCCRELVRRGAILMPDGCSVEWLIASLSHSLHMRGGSHAD